MDLHHFQNKRSIYRPTWKSGDDLEPIHLPKKLAKSHYSPLCTEQSLLTKFLHIFKNNGDIRGYDRLEPSYISPDIFKNKEKRRTNYFFLFFDEKRTA